MALPLTSNEDLDAAPDIPAVTRALIDASSERLTDLMVTYNEFRDYYDNEQPIKYASDEWKRAFGVQFRDLSANWCEVVVDAMETRIQLDRVVYRGDVDGSTGERVELSDESDAIWDVLHINHLEELENTLYNSSLVEGTSTVIVWPDEELGARVDANKAQNVVVFYNPDNPRQVSHAFKRWMTEEGEMRATLYTPDFLWKVKIPSSSIDEPPPNAQRPLADMRNREAEEQSGWVPRLPEETGDPEWPLPNPFGEVPVVEFPGRKGRSELTNILPLQDLLNKTLADMAVAGEYSALRQKFVVTSNEEPEGGWKSVPGNVWHLVPEVDVEGKPLPTQVGTLEETDPGTYIKIIETLLQNISQISKTPTYYFLQSTRQGGRGDAPSGEALRVTETGLIKKVEKVEEAWARSWMRVGRLIHMAVSNFETAPLSLRGDVSWAHAQSHFMTTLLEEAAVMIQDVGLPPEFAWRHIGLTEAQIKQALAWRKENLPEGVVVTRVNIEGQGPGGRNPEGRPTNDNANNN